jgi:hypothetical protein
MKEHKLRNALERFKHKPDEALETIAVGAAYIGCAERTLRYDPRAKRVYIGPNRYNLTAGNIRAIASGNLENWQPIGAAAQRIVESCGADIREKAQS